MPYGSRFKRIKRRRGRRPYRPPSMRSTFSRMNVGQIASIAYGAYKGVNYLRGLVNSEMKKHDVTTSLLPSDAGAVLHLTDIAQGDTDATRDGNSIFLRAINLRGNIVYNSTTAGIQYVTISIVMDKQQVSDTTPSWGDIYDTSGSAIFAHLNNATVGRFSVLYSKTFTLDGVNKIATVFKINKSFRHHVRYNGTASTDIQKGGVYFVYSSNVPTTNFPSINLTSRASFHDN